MVLTVWHQFWLYPYLGWTKQIWFFIHQILINHLTKPFTIYHLPFINKSNHLLFNYLNSIYCEFSYIYADDFFKKIIFILIDIEMINKTYFCFVFCIGLKWALQWRICKVVCRIANYHSQPSQKRVVLSWPLGISIQVSVEDTFRLSQFALAEDECVFGLVLQGKWL